ncbi:hypothetical protein COV20_05965 [Candidatus Woesearchaeota archaeon CG10_big_fil_rev_8_21_14_0_10_45_16]|nr:MAG: hypothetical protein COV20_05965 [Candidatus Woesearchaeota archaeon CG10_big_fil_rev_8_21_14_0_10_45_16]
MNFQKIPPVETADEMLELAFRKARERSNYRSLQGTWLEKIKQKEGIKIDIIKSSLYARLDAVMVVFPDLSVISNFYIKLMRLTIDFGKLKQSLSTLNWAKEQISRLHRMTARKIGRSETKDEIGEASKQFYGRVSSVIKQIDQYLQFLEASRKTMRTYPDIKDLFTVCIYGFPNVGKTTLLNNLTGTTAKIAAYAFTTVTINAGYVTIDGEKVQILDVPGTLAREEKLNNIELQAELALKEVADLIIYVFDLTEQCGFSREVQEQLFATIKTKKPVVVYLSKIDLIPKSQIKSLPYKALSMADLQKEIREVLLSSKTE